MSATGNPPSAWRNTPMIWASVKRLVFITISSCNVPRKFYVHIPSFSGGITMGLGSPAIMLDRPIALVILALAALSLAAVLRRTWQERRRAVAVPPAG